MLNYFFTKTPLFFTSLRIALPIPCKALLYQTNPLRHKTQRDYAATLRCHSKQYQNQTGPCIANALLCNSQPTQNGTYQSIPCRDSTIHNQGYSTPGAAFALHIKAAPLRYFTNPLLYFTKPLLHIANPLLDIAIQFLSRTTVSNTIPALHFGQLHLDQSKHDNAATERFYTNPLRNFTPLHQRNSSQIRYAASRGHNKESQHFS